MTAFEQRAADVSVDHPHIVENYRHAHEIFRRTDDGEASTEDLRQAMQHYRTLFGELLAADGSDNGPDKAEASASTDVSRR